MKKQQNTPLALGNASMRAGKYAEAIRHYADVLIRTPALGKSISANLTLAKQKFRNSRQGIKNQRVGVCGWELAHNAAGRVYTLAMLYETFAEVEIIGSLFPQFGREIWQPVRDTHIAKHTFLVEDESRFIEQAIALVAAHPYDIVHLSKPRAPNIFFGILYKLLWDAKVLVDIDDEELAFVGADTSLSIDDCLKQHQQLPGLNNLAGKDWTRLAVGFVDAFDGITVSNPALQQRYGGEIIRHARDEKLFKPSPELKRKSREKYGIPQNKKVVLFFGTPRKHKGLIETAEAIAALKRDDVLFVIVGDFSDQSLKIKLKQIKGCQIVFVGNQPFGDIHQVVAIADCCVFLQDNGEAAKYQVPAKLSDALGMGVSVLASSTPALEEFFKSGAIENVTNKNLGERLSFVLDNRASQDRATATHSAFIDLLSLSACAKQLESFVALNDNKRALSNISLQQLRQLLGFSPTGFFALFDKPIRLKKDVFPTRASKEKHVTIILSENPERQPDFFQIKSTQALASTVIVTWAEDVAELARMIRLVSESGIPYELVALLPRISVDADKIPLLSAPGLNLTIIGFPRRTGKTAAFLRFIACDAISKYKNLVWIDTESSIGLINNDIVSSFCGERQNHYGVIAESLSKLSDLNLGSAKKYIGTWFSRLHRPTPAGEINVPLGTFLVKTVILKQFSGMSINSNKFDSLDRRHDDESFYWLRTIIGAFAHEGQYKICKLTDYDQVVADSVRNLPCGNRSIKAIAFFLPQFHVISENDAWWGKGFTEWNNVVRAEPLFRSHYQPRLPADLGFYDLRSSATQIAQAKLATEHGIYGFCYYYYWFNGKKLLNEPIEQMLSSGTPDFPFCVCWANENWTRNWDGQNRHVLMEQKYSKESNRALIHEFIEIMCDKRYIRHHGKPVLLVYRIKIIPDWLETAAMWREECRKAGIGEIHLCSIRFGLEPLEGMPAQHGLDAYVLFPPQDTNFVDVRDAVLDLNPDFGGSIFSYDAVASGDIDRFRTGYPWPVHRGAMLGWDNTARRLTAARIFMGCTPMRYRAWLKQIVEQENRYNSDDESLLFINAWNEWAEGTTLEPDQRYGTSYLEATRSILEPYVPELQKPQLSEPVPSDEPLGKAQNVIKQIPMVKLPEWFAGKAAYKTGAPTVLLCAHISGHQLFGGERSFLDVLGALEKLGLNIIVTLPSGNNKKYIDYITTCSLGVYAFHYPQWISARDPDPILTLIFSDIIAAHNVSIVYSNTIVLVEPSLAAKQMNRLSVVHARELITIDDALRERIGLPVQTIIKTVFGRYDFIVANSKATERTFAREDRTYYVPNAVDAKTLEMPNKIGNPIRIGIVSSNIPKKGVGDFIDVAKQCQDIADVAEFVVIGPDNNQIDAWKKDVAEGRLPGNIKFLGYRETPKEAMAEINILLNLSSFAESFGRTVAEAMAARRPVVAYEWGALPELVQHGLTGYLAPFGDTKKVAAYVRQLCKNRTLIQEMGNAGFYYVSEKFSHDSLFQNIKEAYESIKNSQYWWKLASAAVKERASNPVTVIIPIYNATNEVKNCIDSVIKHTPLIHADILLIDDGSSDGDMPLILSKYEGIKGVRVIYNEKNIGYTKTINRGIKQVEGRDVVLLNSDTIVTPGWLAGMRATAYAGRNIGTVTAMSDNAGAFSFPMMGVANPKPDYLTHEEYAIGVIDRTIGCDFVDVPTGSGFCMYIRRDLMDEIGSFDEVLFPRGYGEENDFCIRALKSGWRNVITPWSFVYHVRTASFKGEKEKLVRAGVDAVTERYPDYASLVKAAFAAPEMQVLREAATW